MNYQPDIEETIFILKDALKLGVLKHAETFADYDWDELPDTLREETARMAELLAPLKKAGLKKIGVKNGAPVLPREFKEVWKKVFHSGLLKNSVPLKYGGKNLPLSLDAPVREVLGALSPAFHCYLTSTLEVARLVERRGSDEQKKLFVGKLFDGSWSGAFAISEAYSEFGWDNIKTEAFPEKDYHRIRGEKIMAAAGAHDLTDNIIYLVLARVRLSDEDEGKPALFIVPAYRAGDKAPTDNNVRLLSLRQNPAAGDIPFVSLSYGRDGECRGRLLKGIEPGVEGVLNALQNLHLSAALQAAVQSQIICDAALDYLRQGPNKRASGHFINHYPRLADAAMYMKSLSEGIRTAVYSAYFLTDCGASCAEDQKYFFEDMAEVYSLALKVHATETGLDIINKATRILGPDHEEKLFGAQKRGDLNAGSFLGITNGIAGEHLLDYTLNLHSGRKFNSLMERFKMLDTVKTLTPNLTEALNVWREYVGGLIILVDDLKQVRENDSHHRSKLFVDKILKLLAEVIICYYLIIAGLEAEAKLKEAGVNLYNLRLEVRRKPELLKWYHKIISAEYFALNILSSREGSVRVAQNSPNSALEAIW